MMRDTNPKLIKWSLQQIRKSNYSKKNNIKLFNVLGLNDELVQKWELPSSNFYINNGGHLMVYENAKEVNSILKEILQSIDS